jgi:hypothetical protein
MTNQEINAVLQEARCLIPKLGQMLEWLEDHAPRRDTHGGEGGWGVASVTSDLTMMIKMVEYELSRMGEKVQDGHIPQLDEACRSARAARRQQGS